VGGGGKVGGGIRKDGRREDRGEGERERERENQWRRLAGLNRAFKEP
jgi:hypothetical protein